MSVSLFFISSVYMLKGCTEVSQDEVGLLGCECILFVQQNPHILLGRATVSHFSQSVVMSGISSCQVQHLAFGLADYHVMRFPLAHLSGFSRSLWMTSQPFVLSAGPFSFVSSADLLKVHCLCRWWRYWRGTVPTQVSEGQHSTSAYAWQ